MVSGSLALLYFLLGFHGGRQGSGPDRGRSPVERGDFLSVHLSVRPRPPPLGLKPEAWLAGWASGLAGGPRGGKGWTDERTIEQTDGKSPLLQDFVPYRGRCPASPMKTKEKVEQGKGTADHLTLQLTYSVFVSFLLSPLLSLLLDL